MVGHRFDQRVLTGYQLKPTVSFDFSARKDNRFDSVEKQRDHGEATAFGIKRAVPIQVNESSLSGHKAMGIFRRLLGWLRAILHKGELCQPRDAFVQLFHGATVANHVKSRKFGPAALKIIDVCSLCMLSAGLSVVLLMAETEAFGHS